MPLTLSLIANPSLAFSIWILRVIQEPNLSLYVLEWEVIVLHVVLGRRFVACRLAALFTMLALCANAMAYSAAAERNSCVDIGAVRSLVHIVTVHHIWSGSTMTITGHLNSEVWWHDTGIRVLMWVEWWRAMMLFCNERACAWVNGLEAVVDSEWIFKWLSGLLDVCGFYVCMKGEFECLQTRLLSALTDLLRFCSFLCSPPLQCKD